MDYNLYIILREKDLEAVGISEIKANWEEGNISYNPRRYVSQDEVQLIFSEYKMTAITETSNNKNQLTLKIVDGLRELEWEVNKQIEKLESNNIIKLLQKICRLDKFIIYIFEDDETIRQQIKYTQEENILLLISSALKWESPKNIKIFCE